MKTFIKLVGAAIIFFIVLTVAGLFIMIIPIFSTNTGSYGALNSIGVLLAFCIAFASVWPILRTLNRSEEDSTKQTNTSDREITEPLGNHEVLEDEPKIDES